ncbi:MAG: hypothetical protein J5695_00050 [Bacteroidales bacterium]|nr:hypothetical protein [Bacteroidales bacterium]
MKWFLFALTIVLLSLQGCTGSLKTGSIQTKAGDAGDVGEESLQTCYYILKSSAGFPESSTCFSPNMSDLKANHAQLVITEEKEGTVSLEVEYGFENMYGKDTHTFCMSLENVGCVKVEDKYIFDAYDLSGVCTADGHAADYNNVSVSGSISDGDSSLYFEGVVNGYPFALSVSSVSTDAAAFTSDFLDLVIVDWVPFMEIEVINGTDSDVAFSFEGENVLQPASFGLAPNEAHLIRAHVVSFPFRCTVGITYGDGQEVVVSDTDILSCEHFQNQSSEHSWYLVWSPTGAIEPIGFPHEVYMIK